MAISVYGWRRPTIEVSLVEGGTLLANTKYYVVGFLKYCPLVYNDIGSPISNIAEITTTATARTISIQQKTYRNITNFASGGTGITNVSSDLHCLMSGNQIKIDSGSYAGIWTVTVINKDTFSIPTSYVDNIPVQCYTDSLNYNHPPQLVGYANPVYHLMTYLITTNNPTTNKFTDSRWTNTSFQSNNNTNPAIITAQPLQNYSGHRIHPIGAGLETGTYSSSEPYGTILVYVDGGTYTFQQIADAVVAAGFTNNVHYSSILNTFTVVGTLLFGTTGFLSTKGTDINVVLGEFGAISSTYRANVSVDNSLIHFFPSISEADCEVSANGTVFSNNRTATGIGGLQSGVGNYYLGAPLLSGDVSNNYINLATGLTIQSAKISGKNLLSVGVSSIIQASYGAQVWKDCTLYPIYYILMNSAIDYEPAIYMMENCYMYETPGNVWHYRFYQYPAQDGKYNIIRFLNINTDQVDNKKKWINNRMVNLDANWYRRLEFSIIDSNKNYISGVNINITDSLGNNYSGTTDVNGYCYIDVKEQRTVLTQAMGTFSVWDPTKDTYYYNFSITISKLGYENMSLYTEKAHKLGKQQVQLKTVVNIRDADGNKFIALTPALGSSSRMTKI